MNSSAQSPKGREWPTSLVALAVSAVAAASLVISVRGKLSPSLGDTDDALRLFMVRNLADGVTGWFDTHISRLQPPLGFDPHWSRLVDGGLAAMDRLFALVMAPDQAEWAMRMVWPLVWIFPAAWAVLAIARRMGGKAALLPAAALLMTNILLYTQWWPGRIDHHNIQIALTLAALAGAVAGNVRGAMLAGAATALGLAVGLESLPVMGLIGAGFALRLGLRPLDQAGAARAYGLALFAATSLAYLAQTPPSRLALSACDALAANLWAALAVAGLGLAAAAQFTAARPPAVRWTALALTGVAAAAAYLALNPACLRGPVAEVDPRLAPIWMDHIRELQPMLKAFWTRRSDYIVATLLMSALGAAAWLWLGARREGRTAAWMLSGACLALGFALALGAERMSHYVNWLALPLFAAALGDLTARVWKSSIVPALFIVVATSQPALMALLDVVPGWNKPADASDDAADRCIEPAALRTLAVQPPGLVLGEVDLGPRILARTPHSAVAAPYHRLGQGIFTANAALAAPPGPDEAQVRALRVDYVVACPARKGQINHAGLGAASLQMRLDRGEAPAWLERLSKPGAPLQIYRLRPPVPDS